MIRNVIFDLGRVLVEFDPRAAYLRGFGWDEATVLDVYDAAFGKDWALHDRGDYESIGDLLEALIAKRPDLEEKLRAVFAGDWVAVHKPKADTAAYLAELKARGYGIFLLSNLSKETHAAVKRYPFFSLLDGAVLSYEARALKPEPEIYEALLRRYALDPAECVFVDDVPRNLAGAAQFGIRGVLFTEFPAARLRLEELLAAEGLPTDPARDLTREVNVFQGCGEIDLPRPQGVAAKWFFIKAGCGNTSPGASLPFGAVSAAPFSGGYPTGYGDHMPNSFARPVHFPEGKGLLGFSHVQQSGTGAIGFYYNYAVITPRYADSPARRVPTRETARPGYYACTLEDIRCELTVFDRMAMHRYAFGRPGGTVTVDFANNGLNIPNWGRDGSNVLRTYQAGPHTVCAETELEGLTVRFAVKGNGHFTAGEGRAEMTVPEEGVAELTVSLSPRSAEAVLRRVLNAPAFDDAARAARGAWNRALHAIEIETDDDVVREIFYSNLYHSYIKPADWSEESFLWKEGPFTADLATLWDMYKTALPLVYLTNRTLGERLNETLLRLCETLGFMPNGLGLKRDERMFSDQARMLGFYALFTAYRYGYPLDPKRLLAAFRRDLADPAKRDFTEEHRCVSHTFLLDAAEACALALQIAEETGDEETAALVRPYAALWRSVYDEKTGLLGADSSYYEGTLYNYSFRQHVDMEARIALAGGNERFAMLLDDFFGYGAPDVKLPTDPHDHAAVEAGMRLGRFEGFNNESDTEAPFSYVYAGRHDRTCEIVRAGMKYMFARGRGGLPGNNDSGALSSYYVFMALGLFPVAGQDLFLLGSPFVKHARVNLFNGNALEIRVNGGGDAAIYVREARFNGAPLPGFKIRAGELVRGGTLEFDMAEKAAAGA